MNATDNSNLEEEEEEPTANRNMERYEITAANSTKLEADDKNSEVEGTPMKEEVI